MSENSVGMAEAVEMMKKASELIKSDDAIYAEYTAIKKKIEGNPELFERIKAFKKKDYEYRLRLKDGQEDFDTEKSLSQEYYKLILDSDVNRLFALEHELVTSIAKVYNQLLDATVLDILL